MLYSNDYIDDNNNFIVFTDTVQASALIYKQNARFCEKCGKPTAFFNAKFLRPYTGMNEHYEEQYLQGNPDAFSGVSIQLPDEMPV